VIRNGREKLHGVRWWLVFVLSGVLLGVVGLTLLSGTVQFVAVALGVLFIAFALYRRAGGTDYHRERPNPPGTGGGY
jgi:Flp pilus assembly protein TadB